MTLLHWLNLPSESEAQLYCNVVQADGTGMYRFDVKLESNCNPKIMESLTLFHKKDTKLVL